MTNLEQMTQLVREIEGLKARLERVESMRPQYEILSQDTIATITSDQNNFPLGDYDFAFIAPSGANRTIHGITGGVKGRHLFVRNSGSFSLLFTNQNAAATAENRILTPSTATVTLTPRQWAEFIYVTDATLVTGANRWLMIFPSA